MSYALTQSLRDCLRHLFKCRRKGGCCAAAYANARLHIVDVDQVLCALEDAAAALECNQPFPAKIAGDVTTNKKASN